MMYKSQCYDWSWVTFVSNNFSSFELSFQSKSPRKRFTQKNSTLKTAFNMNFSWAPNKHIRMISVGSCDTEDWNNGCWHRNKLHYEIYRKRLFYIIYKTTTTKNKTKILYFSIYFIPRLQYFALMISIKTWPWGRHVTNITAVQTKCMVLFMKWKNVK